MKTLFTLSLISLFVYHSGLAQQYKTNQAFGQVDMADLTLTSCSFEKDANAMVLLDKGEMTTNVDSVVVNYHMRIKIFNSAGNDAANIRLPYYSRNNLQQITQVEAQTINLEDNHVVYTKVEPSQIYTETIDKYRKAIVFAFPKVKPGCIIEYKYKSKRLGLVNPPAWYFQESLPVRYSELTGWMSKTTRYKIISRGNQPFATDTLEQSDNNKEVSKKVWAKANIPSFTGESFVSSSTANAQCIMFQLNSFEWDTEYKIQNGWHKIAFDLGFDDNFGVELSFRLSH
ncbi:uncharacterized protein DUF3857 [Mucilaginibacter gracilis]|uniref:Uncharacterized protein DUF3857 n=1 Tax=Mucilaginibacter gracilis TaxID=423350 RepID=A0A495J764_9SPHI|nr:DUF3857 domain-containing protein [Mucilaginibacter gracilis]RKR84830.1 uncharacterized protein DUF3857 [Mucilaginibacter gracilis]